MPKNAVPRMPSPAEMIGSELGMHINKVSAQFKQYESFLTITQNIVLSLARACKVDPVVLAEMMANEQGNKRFEEDVLKQYQKLLYKFSRQSMEVDNMKKGLKK